MGWGARLKKGRKWVVEMPPWVKALAAKPDYMKSFASFYGGSMGQGARTQGVIWLIVSILVLQGGQSFFSSIVP